MIELIAAATTGAVVGGGVVWLPYREALRNAIAERGPFSDLDRADFASTLETLEALRSNCFIPDHRGVKVRYSQASVERRVKAETPKEVA